MTPASNINQKSCPDFKFILYPVPITKHEASTFGYDVLDSMLSSEQAKYSLIDLHVIKTTVAQLQYG